MCCCSVLQCVAVCCSVLQCVAMWFEVNLMCLPSFLIQIDLFIVYFHYRVAKTCRMPHLYRSFHAKEPYN